MFLMNLMEAHQDVGGEQKSQAAPESGGRSAEKSPGNTVDVVSLFVTHSRLFSDPSDAEDALYQSSVCITRLPVALRVCNADGQGAQRCSGLMDGSSHLLLTAG